MSGFEPLVKFNDNFDDNDLYYFDFSDNTWVKCEPIEKLPYNLCKYQIKNSNHTFITCTDSYRLIDNLDDALSNDEMYKEKEWRDTIVKKEELDLYAKGEWHKMVVAWKKADIIPDVLHLQRRRNASNLCGYFYKESKSLAKSCSKTPVITEEQLQKEKEQDEESIKYREDKIDAITKIEKTLKLFKIKDEYHKFYDPKIKDRFFYDTLPYYQSLRLDTEQKVISKEDWSSQAKITYEEYLAYSNREKGFINLVRQTTNRIRKEENTTDMVSVEDEYTDLKKCQIENCNYQYLKCDYDAFYNIKIYNATYATLCCDPREIDCDIIDTIDGKNIFGLKDITETNPIFNGAIADTIRIKTDGDKITFTGILMDSMPRYILKAAQLFTVIHFPSKGIVMLCNTFCTATNTYPYERIEETSHDSSLYKLTKPL